MRPSPILTCALVSATILLAAGCGSTSPSVAPDPGGDSNPAGEFFGGFGRPDAGPTVPMPEHAAPSPAVAALYDEIDSWLGTPYLWGGTTRGGVDCSAFVQNVFADALGLEVPRTTSQQRHEGMEVSTYELELGDLVFFVTPAKTGHVGIYLGEGRFAHASSSRGVMISELSEPYWQRAFTHAQRPDGLAAKLASR